MRMHQFFPIYLCKQHEPKRFKKEIGTNEGVYSPLNPKWDHAVPSTSTGIAGNGTLIICINEANSGLWEGLSEDSIAVLDVAKYLQVASNLISRFRLFRYFHSKYLDSFSAANPEAARMSKTQV